jgi:hypothetical protein
MLFRESLVRAEAPQPPPLAAGCKANPGARLSQGGAPV